ncbi:MAG: hypothetical protein HY898_31020 [Deltaproteobacteria bacterium]|nr:hypothetical protein [Deltaproteobacteria bacterium]
MKKAGAWGVAAIVGVMAVACSGNFDTTRTPRAFADRATLGQEIYAVLCDRVGASALGEDLSGESYRAVCHPDELGTYADFVDQSKLPPASGAAAIARNLSVAKVEALARRRSEVVRALDVIFPDIEIDDPHPSAGLPGAPKKVRLHDALRTLTQRLSPLYDSNPLAASGGTSAPLLPAGTQSLARVFEALNNSSQAQTALSRIGGREGYRPLSVAMGAIKPVLLYPDLRGFVQQSVRMLSPGGPARDEFMQVLRVAHNELATSEPTLALSPVVIQDPDGIDQPNRPRENLEILQTVLLDSDAAFGDNTSPAPIVVRDPRGFALVAGSKPGVAGSVPAPFADLYHDGPDGPVPGADGLADVDAFGRFIDGNGNPVLVDVPFDTPGTKRVRNADSQGRALLDDGKVAYEYLDTKQTLVASLARTLRALSDPDPANDHETLMSALAGLYVLAGDRVPNATAVYNDDLSLKYNGFDASSSPLVDLVYAAGQVLSDPESDDFLQSLIDLMQNNEQDVARLIGVALELKRLADNHPEASIPGTATIWDEIADALTKVSAVGPANGDPDGKSLMEDLILALADDRSLLLADAYRKFFTYRDRVSYNPNDINGPVWNLESGDTQPPHVPVDRTSPASGFNRSAFQRSLQLIYDTTGITACNKHGALMHLKAGVLGMTMDTTYPTDGLFSVLCPIAKQDPVAECSVYEIQNLSHFYVQSLLETDPNPPADFINRHKATIVVKDACMSSLGGITDMDKTFEDSSTILGLTTHPTQTAMSRLVFFGSDSWTLPMPDLDPTRNDINARLNAFLADMQDPFGTPSCPKDAMGLNVCSDASLTLRVHNAATIFLWEHFQFNDAMRPLLRAFYDHDREDLFTELVEIVNRHMNGPVHGPECSKKGSWRKNAPDYNPAYCSEAGVVSYEPLLAEQFASAADLFPTIQRVARALANQKIKSSRYRQQNGWPTIERRGTEIAAIMTRALFSSDYAASRKLTDRNGKASTVWSDNVTVKPQVTPYDLFANSLKRIDDRFVSAQGFTAEDREERRKQWRKARSQLVDQFLAVDGSAANAKFRNPATPKALVRVMKVLREQLNARCPDREKGKGCQWASQQMAGKLSEVVQGPLFATALDLLEKLRADPSHIELEKVLQYLLNFVSDDEALRSVLASSTDVVQVLRDGQTLPPIFNVLAALSVPDDGVALSQPGAADVALQLLQVLVTEPDELLDPSHETEFDRYHVVEHILANVVKPIDDSQPSKTALEVLAEVAGDVSRVDSSNTGPLAPDDWGAISRSVTDFLVSPTRGMEQLYTVVRSRNGD